MGILKRCTMCDVRCTSDGSRVMSHESRSKGFTIIEIVFVIAVLGLIVIAVMPFFRTVIESWEVKDRQIEVVQIARVAMNKMVKEIKTATEFKKANTDKIEFKDWDDNGVKFELKGDKLEREGDSIAEPIDALTFTYYKLDGTTTTDKNEVYSVKIEMTVSDSESKVNPVILTSLVVMRKDLGSEGVMFSKNSDFSTEDSTFSTDETFYYKIWTSAVDYNDIDKLKYQLEKGGTKYKYDKGDITNHLDTTYTHSVSLSGFDTGTWDVKKMEVKDNSGTKYKPSDRQITITAP